MVVETVLVVVAQLQLVERAFAPDSVNVNAFLVHVLDQGIICEDLILLNENIIGSRDKRKHG